MDDIASDSVVSVTSSHDVLVMCDMSNKLKVFSTNGVLRRRVDLQPDIVHVTSAMESIPGHYLVTHGKYLDSLHRVCLVNNDGKILRAYGSQPTLLYYPMAVAVDADGFVYVIEEETRRLVILSPTLECINFMQHGLSAGSRRMKMDKALKRIFVCTGDRLFGVNVVVLRLGYDRRCR